MTWPICLPPAPPVRCPPAARFVVPPHFQGCLKTSLLAWDANPLKKSPPKAIWGCSIILLLLSGGGLSFPPPQISPYPSSLSLTIALGFKRLQTRSSSGHTHNVDLIRSYSDANRAILALKHWCIFPGTDTIGFDFLPLFSLPLVILECLI